MQTEGTKLIIIMNFSVLHFFKFASKMPQIAQILVSTFKIFWDLGEGGGGGGGDGDGPPRNFLSFFFFISNSSSWVLVSDPTNTSWGERGGRGGEGGTLMSNQWDKNVQQFTFPISRLSKQ